MSCYPVRGLPLLPGYTVRDPTKSRFGRPQTFSYRNGLALPLVPRVGIGGDPLHVNPLSQADVDQLADTRPTLTYGQARQAPPSDFIPGHVAFDKQVLRFYGYFKETVRESPAEVYRVRRIVLLYHLEDDSIAISEPAVDNAGLPQGPLIARQRLPRDDQGHTWHWRHLNMATDFTAYGKRFRLTGCDRFTWDFMLSHGMVPNCPEDIPPDPYMENRKEPPREHRTPSDFDKLKQFLTFDRQVLRFYAVWGEDEDGPGQCRRYIIHYFLADGTLEIREVYQKNDGRDPFPVLVGRQRLAKSLKQPTASFPAIVLEVSAAEVGEWLGPRDLVVGQHVTVLGRRFFIYDCDPFTRSFYQDHVRGIDLHPVDISIKPPAPEDKWIPPYNGFGSLEDSVENCLSLIPKVPKKDVIKMLENDKITLRYECRMESRFPEDRQRRFILSFYVATDTISIFEPPLRNSGRTGGKILSKVKIPKPGSTADKPRFYTTPDLAIGSTVEVIGYLFIITDADEFVYKYVEEHAADIPAETVASFRQKAQERARAAACEARPAAVEETDPCPPVTGVGECPVPPECQQLLDISPLAAQLSRNTCLPLPSDMLVPRYQVERPTPLDPAKTPAPPPGDICAPQLMRNTQTPLDLGGRTQGDARSPQYQGDPCPPRYQGDSPRPQYQGDPCIPQYQGNTRSAQYQGNSQSPQYQGDARCPQYQGDPCPPLYQGNARSPQYAINTLTQGNGLQRTVPTPQSQGNDCARTPQYQGDMCSPLGQPRPPPC